MIEIVACRTAADSAKKLTAPTAQGITLQLQGIARYYLARMIGTRHGALPRAARALSTRVPRSATRFGVRRAAVALQWPCSAGVCTTVLVLHPVVKELPN